MINIETTESDKPCEGQIIQSDLILIALWVVALPQRQNMVKVAKTYKKEIADLYTLKWGDENQEITKELYEGLSSSINTSLLINNINKFKK